jgi:hypothetical protein
MPKHLDLSRPATLVHLASCGMPIPLEDDDLKTCRDRAARVLRRRRKEHFIVVTQSRGHRWECIEPDDAFMVPDTAGILHLRLTPAPEEPDEEPDEEPPLTHDPETPLDRHALADMDDDPRCPRCGGRTLARDGLQQVATTEYWQDGEKIDQDEGDSYGDAPYCTVRWTCKTPGCGWEQTYDVGEGA